MLYFTIHCVFIHFIDLGDFNIMIAGTETTATTVEWAMSNIMQNHNIMKRLQEELVEVVGLNNIVEEHHLPKLKYLDATIKETLRMHSIVPFLIPRSPSKECMVGGYTIPKGCTIILNVWSIHRDPRYWDDPLNFNPERFLTNKWDYNGNNLIYFPFGSGRRLCAGVPLAEKMLMLILASLLHSFDWSIPKGEKHDLTEIYSIAIKKRKPLTAIPSQRLTDVSLYM
ncbi:putative cytochrome P450 [Helianthus annuus]|uniref:Cytochrome P450 n=1 Tax=Helianthus annuus TaxID=4232 RepID=A0A9K3J1B9_HELAN|nr:putative cytochrome P450 [Helianthus annuus]KAJ0923838.1 putative cytochrome P450 [Helianthus annuus]